MSILDNDHQESMASEMEIATDRCYRGIGKRHTFTRAVDACIFVLEIQNWLYKHWAYAMMWTNTDFSECILDSVREEYRTYYWPGHYGSVFSNSDGKYPDPETQNIVVHHSSPELSWDGKEICHKISAELITLPKVSISAIQGVATPNPYPPPSSTSSNTKYVVYWPSNGCDLVLTDVDTFPRELGYWINDTFAWNLPVNSVYLYRCPNVDPRILKLPYVKTFEELGWT